MTLKVGAGGSSTDTSGGMTIQPYKWYDVVQRLRLSNATSGYVQVWIKDVATQVETLILDYAGKLNNTGTTWARYMVGPYGGTTVNNYTYVFHYGPVRIHRGANARPKVEPR